MCVSQFLTCRVHFLNHVLLMTKVPNNPCLGQVEIIIERFGIDLLHHQIKLVQATPNSNYTRLAHLLDACDDADYPSCHAVGTVSGHTNNGKTQVRCHSIQERHKSYEHCFSDVVFLKGNYHQVEVVQVFLYDKWESYVKIGILVVCCHIKFQK